MPKILLQEEVSFEALDTLTIEFPHLDFIDHCEHDYDWHGVEIIYGSSLLEKELAIAPRLRWIHCPGADTRNLCMDKIKKRGDILISLGARFNATQIAEYVMGGILSFAKQFFNWEKAPRETEEFWNWPLKETMWTLKGRLLLQIGLGHLGTEIVRHGNFFGMKSWGIQKARSFHPYCKKTFSMNELHSILPQADVVVIALPNKGLQKILFGLAEFKLMKPDSIFILVGSGGMVDEQALIEVAKSKKFRGILLDAFHFGPPKKNSPLWSLPNTHLTPMVAGIPETDDLPSLRLFRRNLRHYIPGKIKEMKNLVVV